MQAWLADPLPFLSTCQSWSRCTGVQPRFRSFPEHLWSAATSSLALGASLLLSRQGATASLWGNKHLSSRPNNLTSQSLAAFTLDSPSVNGIIPCNPKNCKLFASFQRVCFCPFLKFSGWIFRRNPNGFMTDRAYHYIRLVEVYFFKPRFKFSWL